MALTHHLVTVSLLCAIGFFKEMKPSEPYIVEYHILYKNMTTKQVDEEIYPVWSCSCFAFLVPVFITADFVKYQPMIVLESTCYVVSRVILLWADGTFAMQMMQLIYGWVTSLEVAYYTYIYAKVPKADYKLVSCFVRVAVLLGRFMSGVLSQFLVSFGLLNVKQLNYISLATGGLALCLGLFLPKVQTSIYCHNSDEDLSLCIENEDDEDQNGNNGKQKKEIMKEERRKKSAFDVIRGHFVGAYRQSYVLKWSLWVILSSGIYYQEMHYVQPLWEEVQPVGGVKYSTESSGVYNGLVEAAATLFSAIAVTLVGIIKCDWESHGDSAIFFMSVLGGSTLVAMGSADQIWLAYGGYVLFRGIFDVTMTVASFEVAKHIPDDSYGLVFGLNMWLGLGLQALLTVTVSSSLGLAMDVMRQYVVYGCLYSFLGANLALISMLRRENVPICRRIKYSNLA